jgi:hypothetical protein
MELLDLIRISRVMVAVATLYVHVKVFKKTHFGHFLLEGVGKYKRNSEKYIFGLVSGYLKYQSG